MLVSKGDHNKNKIQQTKLYNGSLLYHQKYEFYKHYKGNNKEEFKKKKYYYLTNKSWFNEYKEFLDFNEFEKNLETNKELKSNLKLTDSLIKKKLKMEYSNKLDSINLNIAYKKEEKFFEQYNIYIPKNIELIKEDYYKNILNSEPQFTICGVYLGFNTLLMTIGEDDKNIFCCELKDEMIKDKEFNVNFNVIIKGILQIKKEDIDSGFIAELIANKKGLNNIIIYLLYI